MKEKNYTDAEMKPVSEHNILEINDSVMYIMITLDNKYLLAGTGCNVGFLEHNRFEYDDVFSLDENIQAFVEQLESEEV